MAILHENMKTKDLVRALQYDGRAQKAEHSQNLEDK